MSIFWGWVFETKKQTKRWKISTNFARIEFIHINTYSKKQQLVNIINELRQLTHADIDWLMKKRKCERQKCEI